MRKTTPSHTPVASIWPAVLRMDWHLQHCAHWVAGWIAEYEGFFEADEQLLTELIATTRKLLKIVEVMDASGSLERE